MKSRSRSSAPTALFLVAFACAFLQLPHISTAQQASDSGYHTSESSALDEQTQDSGYSVAESAADKAADKGDLRSEGPVRMARFAYVAGNVTWRDGPTGDWSQATVNMPIRQGAEILVLKGGRADLQFDDGSELRLGNGALVSLKTLYSDSKGEFTQVTLKDGLATLYSRHTDSVYQIDTPIASVKSVGPSQVRLGVDGGSEIAVQNGSATIEGAQGKTVVKEGNYVYLATVASAYNAQPNPAPDTWDNWNSDRNKLLASTTETYRHVPANIGLVAGDLDAYGAWHKDAANGWVWSPSNQGQDWRPYENGRWVWADPYGWTWVSDEPWGWAPYHYGTWFQGDQGWSWCPGPYSQYWSPGVVSFTDYGSGIGWAPLCPWEVTYPAFCGVGFWGSNWGLNFSIGWCGCYYPFGGGFCEGRRFDNRFVNRFHDRGDRFANGFRDHGFGNSSGARGANRGFVPFNARNGATSASREAFGGKGSYQAVSKGSSIFGSGRTIGAPAKGGTVSGPKSIQPTAASRTATRETASSSPSRSLEGRQTYQGSLPSNVARSADSARSSAAANGFGRSGNMSAFEAARSARTSLNYSGRSDTSRSATTGGAFTGRSTFGSGQPGRSFGTGENGASRSFGGYGGGSNRSAPYYGGSGYSAGRTGGFSGGGRSFGGGGSFSGGRAFSGGGGRSFSGGGRAPGGRATGGGRAGGGRR